MWNIFKNKKDLITSIDCDRNGKCLECVKYHHENGSFLRCFYGKENFEIEELKKENKRLELLLLEKENIVQERLEQIRLKEEQEKEDSEQLGK